MKDSWFKKTTPKAIKNLIIRAYYHSMTCHVWPCIKCETYLNQIKFLTPQAKEPSEIMKKKIIKAWAIVPDKGLPTFFTRSREEAEYQAEDICFMGSKGLPEKIIRCEIHIQLP